MRLTVVLDRIEEGKAVLLCCPDEREKLIWPVELLPEGTMEGDILTFEISKDEFATAKSRERVANLLEKLVKR